MAEKVSTLVVTLNHGCCRCFTKIRKTVCKLQETEDIRAISCEVSGTVMISGAFDSSTRWCSPASSGARRACLIRDIQLVAAELRLTPQPPAMLPKPPGQAPSCCCGFCICGCGGYDYGYGYGCRGCGCQAYACVNRPPCYAELPLGQYPKIEVT